MTTIFRYRAIAALLAAVLIVSSCASLDGANKGLGKERECNPLVWGVTAAAVCAVVTGGRMTDAAICGAIFGFGCHVFNSYKAYQLKSAKEVSGDYVRINRELPDLPVVTAYETSLLPRSRVKNGEKLTLLSDIEVAPGKDTESVILEEELTIRDAAGVVWAGPKKKMANEQTKTAGRYTTWFELRILQEMQRGHYRYEKTLHVDGQPVSGRSANGAFEVVRTGDITVALME